MNPPYKTLKTTLSLFAAVAVGLVSLAGNCTAATGNEVRRRISLQQLQ